MNTTCSATRKNRRGYDRIGLDLAYQYNRAGQLTQISYKTSAMGEQHNLGYVYDDFGRASQICFDGNIVREYEYDTHTGTLLNMKDYRGFDENDIDDYIKTAYTYNSAGLVTQITYSDKTFIGDDNPSGITEQYTVQYDGRGYIVGERLDTDYSKTEAATSLYKAYEYDAIRKLIIMKKQIKSGLRWGFKRIRIVIKKGK